MLGNVYPNSLRSNLSPQGVLQTFNYAWDFNINRQHSVLSGIIGSIDGNHDLAVPSSISFIGDGRTLASFTVNPDTPPTEITVNITGARILRILVDQPVEVVAWGTSRGTWMAFTNVMIY